MSPARETFVFSTQLAPRSAHRVDVRAKGEGRRKTGGERPIAVIQEAVHFPEYLHLNQWSPVVYPNRSVQFQNPAAQVAWISLASILDVEAQARLLTALGDLFSSPVRGQILLLLLQNPALSITALAVLTQTSVSLASHHVSVLKRLGLLRIRASGRQKQASLAEVSIELMPDALRIARGLKAAQASCAKRGNAAPSHSRKESAIDSTEPTDDRM
jgi:DNA-binding transcriptional ArsR family regulator